MFLPKPPTEMRTIRRKARVYMEAVPRAKTSFLFG